jgi:hypothetical protein
METFITLVNNMDTTYEMANGTKHFQGKKVDQELVEAFRSLNDEEKVLVAKHFEKDFNKRLYYTYVGDIMSKFLKGA